MVFIIRLVIGSMLHFLLISSRYAKRMKRKITSQTKGFWVIRSLVRKQKLRILRLFSDKMQIARVRHFDPRVNNIAFIQTGGASSQIALVA
jgi:hypothetical protein